MRTVESRLRGATREERDKLVEVLRATGNRDADMITALRKQSRSVLGRWFGDELSYYGILTKIVQSENLSHKVGSNPSFAKLEECIAERVFEKYRESLSPAERETLDRDLQELRSKLLKDRNGFGALAGGLIAAQLAASASGFGIYILASSVLGGLSHAVGITLPFALYMGLSSTIALVIGPIGLALSAGTLLLALLRNDLSRSMMAVFIFNGIRERTRWNLTLDFAGTDCRRWFLPLEECQSLFSLKLFLADLTEHRSHLSSSRGFPFILAVTGSLDSSVASANETANWLRAIPGLTTSEEAIQIAERTVAQFNRLRPERVPAILAGFQRTTLSAAAACYTAAPGDSEMHYASAMLLASQVGNFHKEKIHFE